MAEGYEPNEAAAMAIGSQASLKTNSPTSKRMKVSDTPIMKNMKKEETDDSDSMSESSEEDDEDETLDLGRLKRMVVVAKDLHVTSKMDEEFAYESMLETISSVFGKARHFVQSFDKGTNASEAQSAFEILFNTKPDNGGVPRCVRDHLVDTLKELVREMNNDDETKKRMNQKSNDDILVFVLLPMAYRELEASEHHAEILTPFCKAFSALNKKARFRLVNIWSRAWTETQFEGVLTMFHTFVTLHLYTLDGTTTLFDQIDGVMDFMKFLFKANELHEKREGRLIVSADKFYNEPVNSDVNFVTDVRLSTLECDTIF